MRSISGDLAPLMFKISFILLCGAPMPICMSMPEQRTAAECEFGYVTVRVSGEGLPDTCAEVGLTHLTCRTSVRVTLLGAERLISPSSIGLFDMGRTIYPSPFVDPRRTNPDGRVRAGNWNRHSERHNGRDGCVIDSQLVTDAPYQG